MKTLDGLRKINKKQNQLAEKEVEIKEKPCVADPGKRKFLKLAGIAGAGALAYSLLPRQASALIFGSNMRTDSVGVKDAAGTLINPSTKENQETLVTNTSSFSTVLTTQVTLTSANTAYRLPGTEQTGRRTVIVYNISDTDVFIGDSSVTTSNGILLPSGGVMNLDAASGVFGVCASAGKNLNVLELK